MQILFFCPRWGQANLSWDEFAAKVKDAGYDGVETDIPESEPEKEKLLQALAKNNLLLIAQHWETVDADFDIHKSVYAQRLEKLISVKPLFINSQTGKDFFSARQNDELILLTEDISNSTGVPIFHETHRGKFSFAVHITKDFLQRLPGLQLTLDISHWINVAETFLENQEEAVDLALSRTRHIHARVGYIEGPQVPDPRIPYWQDALQQHLNFWDKAVDMNRKKGNAMLTFTTEFGPVPYMPLNPATGKEVADQCEVNVFMKELLKNRYN